MMGYKISNDFIAKTEFDKLYAPANISVDDNKMAITLVLL